MRERKRRVLILNNYPMDRVMREVELGETPDHVLFGVNRLAALGFEPVFLPYPAVGRWATFQSLLGRLRIPLELGDLQQQVLALRLSGEADLVYAPCGSQTHLLQYLRAAGLFKLPIVTLMHHPFPNGKLDFLRGWQRQLFIRGADRLPSLSQALAEDLRAAGAAESKLVPLPWGADVGFYGPWQPPGIGVIATGRTGRDFKTFAQAVSQARCPATLIGLQGHLNDPVYRTTSRLTLIEARNEQPVPGEDRGWIKYPALCDHMRAHAAIAIPLFAQLTLAGVTSLMDALGLGRAVLMTRNRHIDLDIEAEGIGFWIDAGDVTGWMDRLNWIADNPGEVKAMGLRARQLAETSLSSAAFADRVVNVLHQALKSNA
jgi:glycosyltransferase involved in cell wall biosynthesis